MSIKIYLDDDLQYRVTPDGYIRFTTGEDLISYVESSNEIEIDTISFDNDLGLNILEGYDVFKYMIDNSWDVKNVIIHSANVVARKNMESYLNSAIKVGFSDIKLKRS